MLAGQTTTTSGDPIHSHVIMTFTKINSAVRTRKAENFFRASFNFACVCCFRLLFSFLCRFTISFQVSARIFSLDTMRLSRGEQFDNKVIQSRIRGYSANEVFETLVEKASYFEF